MKRISLLFLALSLFSASYARAQPTVVQASLIANGSQISQDNTTTLTGTTLGNGVIFVIITVGGTDPGTYSIVGGGETVVEVGTYASGTSGCCGTMGSQVVYIKSLASGGSKTITTSTNVQWHVMAIEVSGHDTTDFHDTGAACNDTGTGTTMSCNLTTNAANDLVVLAAVGHDSGVTVGSGYTRVGTGNGVCLEYDADVGAAGSKTPDCSTSGSGAYIVRAAAFKPAGAGGGTGAVGPVNRRRTQ